MSTALRSAFVRPFARTPPRSMTDIDRAAAGAAATRAAVRATTEPTRAARIGMQPRYAGPRRTATGGLSHPGRLEPVRLCELGVLLGQLLGERDHHLALLPGGVVL